MIPHCCICHQRHYGGCSRDVSEIGFLRSLRIGMGIDTADDRKRLLKAADKLARLEVFDLALALSEMPEHTLWCVGNMEDGPFARVVLPNPSGGYLGGYREATGNTPAEALRFACAAVGAALEDAYCAAQGTEAIAAGSGTAETVQLAQCEASQSGGAETPHRPEQSA